MPDAPVILDIDDLYEVTASRWQTTKSDLGPVRRFLDELGIRHLRYTWRRAHMRHADQVEFALVCSEPDRCRIPAPNVLVLPNAYRGKVREPAQHSSKPPTLLYQAIFTYHVNEDAARFLADRVFPFVRQEVPDARLLLVGHHGGRLDDLADRQGLHVTGLVPDITPWLRQAHVQTVPLRAGSGTRTKILEATANGLPVVSTTVGVEGLELIHGRHAYVADDAKRFAGHCVELLQRPDRGLELVIAAQDILRDRLNANDVRAQIAVIAKKAIETRGVI
jgi:glycosyltransferase involved in cell wall biosynthesis